MKFLIALLVAALATESAAGVQIGKMDPKTGMAIPVCNGSNDGACVTADAVTTHDKKSHGYKQDHEWSHS